MLSSKKLTDILYEAWDFYANGEFSLQPEDMGNLRTDSEEEVLSACINISGDWQCAVVLTVSDSLLKKVAGAFYEIDIEDISEEELNDILMEITNIIGGNVMNESEGSNTLSLPMFIAGTNYQIYIPRTKMVMSLLFSYQGKEKISLSIQELFEE